MSKGHTDPHTFSLHLYRYTYSQYSQGKNKKNCTKLRILFCATLQVSVLCPKIGVRLHRNLRIRLRSFREKMSCHPCHEHYRNKRDNVSDNGDRAALGYEYVEYAVERNRDRKESEYTRSTKPFFVPKAVKSDGNEQCAYHVSRTRTETADEED